MKMNKLRLHVSRRMNLTNLINGAAEEYYKQQFILSFKASKICYIRIDIDIQIFVTCIKNGGNNKFQSLDSSSLGG